MVPTLQSQFVNLIGPAINNSPTTPPGCWNYTIGLARACACARGAAATTELVKWSDSREPHFVAWHVGWDPGIPKTPFWWHVETVGMVEGEEQIAGEELSGLRVNMSQAGFSRTSGAGTLWNRSVHCWFAPSINALFFFVEVGSWIANT